MDKSLLVMAAGIGSRFGGPKQLAPLGPYRETLLQFAIHDALKNHFSHLILIIQPGAQDHFLPLLPKNITTTFVEQHIPQKHTKPLGTGHAVLCAKDAITTPFLVINADDFYGPSAYTTAANFLNTATSTQCALVGYPLHQTLSKNGTVSRAICHMENHQLTSLENIDAIPFENDYSHSTLASMNFWALQPSIFTPLQSLFEDFSKNTLPQNPTAEFGLPQALQSMLQNNQITIDVLPTTETWCGVTYPDDAQLVKSHLHTLTAQGAYPSPL